MAAGAINGFAKDVRWPVFDDAGEVSTRNAGIGGVGEAALAVEYVARLDG